MNGFGAYANPLTDEWGDYINITEYFVNDYDKNNLIPLRFKIKNNWEKFDEQNIDIGKVRRDVLTKVEYPISSLPPLKGGKDTEFWSLENVYDENGNLVNTGSFEKGDPDVSFYENLISPSGYIDSYAWSEAKMYRSNPEK